MKKINLLVVDPFVPQSYYILRSLRKYCRRIIVVRWKGGLLPRIFSYTANSKYVSKVYAVRYPVENWERAIFFSENSESVERFISDIICLSKKEKINLIYPTNDFTVFILSKNQDLFSKRGIRIPVPHISVLRKVVDKYRMTELANSNDILCPRTFLVSNLQEFDKGMQQLRFPMILKWRFGSGSRGVKFIDENNYGLIRQYLSKNLNKNYLLQEFIPGKEMVYVRIYMNRQHISVVESYVRSKRPELRIFQGRGISEETIEPPEVVRKVKDLFSNLKYAGYGHVQLKRDERDSALKFLELNPRISQGTWAEMSLGFNAPFVNYSLFYRKDYGFDVYNRPAGIFFLYPIQDSIILIKYLMYLLRKKIYQVSTFLFKKKNPLERLPFLSELISDFKKRHLSSKFSQRRYGFFLQSLLDDPLVSVCYWLAYSYEVLKKRYPHEF